MKNLLTKQMRVVVIITLIAASLITFFSIKKCSGDTENNFPSYKAVGTEEREKYFDSVYKGIIIDRRIISRRGKSGEIYTYYIVQVSKGISDWKNDIKVSKEQYFNKGRGLRFGDEIYYKRFDLEKVSEEERNIIPDFYLEKIINKQEKND